MTRSFFRTLLFLLLIAAASAAVGGAHYALGGGTLAALRESVATLIGKTQSRITAVAPAVAPALTRASYPANGSGSIRVYFAPITGNGSERLDQAFLDFLRSARTSIHAAFYEFEWLDAARVLAEKRREGLDVGLVTDSDYKDSEALKACLQAGIRVVFDDRSPFMHNKFCVVDGARVWTGSTNCTDNCLYRNNNNSLLIASDKLAADYSAEFQEMFAAGKFGGKSPSATPFPALEIDGAPVECYFAPEDNVCREIESEIDAAATGIDFLAFSFTSRDLAEAMARKMKDGVQVRGLFDARQAAGKSSQDEYLAEKGALIRLNKKRDGGAAGFMHNKVIVIDGKTLITGSYNFSKAAEEKNDENVLIIHNPAVASLYVREFERLALN